MSDNSIYFANKPAEERASILISKTDQWFQSMDTSGYLSKLRTMYAAYHGAYFTDSGDSHNISFSGEQGELVQMAINHLHNMCTIMINMITATRPSMQARSINTDYKSLVQTKLANGLLDYYMRDKRLEAYLKTAVEYAIVLGAGYIKLEWNATAGEIYDYNEELGVEIREGDLEFSTLSPFDVFFDTNRENRDHDWIITRSFKSRFDLIAKYPEHEDRILRLPTKNTLKKFASFTFHQDETDLIPVYEFYHKRTEAVPDGIYQLFLSEDISLLESPLPYRSLPIYSIAPGYYLGTPFGYSPMFDLLGIQDAVNSLYSAVLTNHTAFAVQNIVVPQGANVSMSELSGNLNVIEYNQQLGEIKPLNLTQTPKEVFEFIQILEKAMETISGINSVSRGNPDPNLRSGNALALVQSMSLQYISGLQQSYAMTIEDLGTGIINVLKDHANVPRVATIVGKNNRTYLEEFTGDQLSAVNRVVVDIGNPLARTTAGRVEMAEQLLQMGAIKTPEQYFSVINTGQLDVMTEDTQAQLFLVKAENERLVKGQHVAAIFTDEHALHIKEHATVLADPELRFDPELFQKVSAHIQEHVDLLRSTDPNILGILGQQPLAPVGGSPNAPQQGQPTAPSNSPDLAPPGGPLAASQLDQTGSAPQNLPTVPMPPEGTQVNPELAKQQYAQLTGQAPQ
jgi:hypothetical protein